MVGICYYYTPHPTLLRDLFMMNLESFGIKGYELGLASDEKIRIGQDITIIDTTQELPSNIPIVIAAPLDGKNIQGEVSLVDFIHPEECIYWFGPDDRDTQSEDIAGLNIHSKVYIPGDRHLWSGQASTVFLYDRMVKS
jgi:hypothetical protein